VTYRVGETLAGYRDARLVAYQADGQTWAAAYIAGDFVRAHPDTGWGVRDHDGRTRRLTSRELAQLHQLPVADLDLPLWPDQESLFDGDAVNQARLTHRPASQVKIVPPVWLWRCWLVAGAVHLLVGRQGSGKSTFAAWVVAQLSTGRPWPGETDRGPIRCGMLSLEEPADRLAARLVAAGARLDDVEILGDVEDHDDDGHPYRRPWRLPGDCAVLETAIIHLDLQAVTIDGLGYSIGGDSHNYANVGSALSALAGVAERTGAAILGLTHPPKGNSDAVTAAIGSTAWTAVARISWVMGADPTDETGARRVVRPAPGSNYRLPDRGLSFAIGDHDETEAGFVTSLQPSDVDAQSITAPPVPASDEERSALDEAVTFLHDYLGVGAQRATDVKTAARKAGIAERTLERARPRAGIVSQREGFGPGTFYWWSLAPCSPCSPAEPHVRQPPESGEHDLHVANMDTGGDC
jgi:hypothetical protein